MDPPSIPSAEPSYTTEEPGGVYMLGVNLSTKSKWFQVRTPVLAITRGHPLESPITLLRDYCPHFLPMFVTSIQRAHDDGRSLENVLIIA